jgi:uracil-DNA glycosylase
MPLDERQLAMLRILRVPYWQPAAALPPPPTALVAAPASPDTTAAGALISDPARAARQPAATTAARTPVVAAPGSPPAAADLPQIDVSRLGWADLREAVAECRACSLCQTRRQTVFGVGHPRAHWMIVGEAPGEQEDQRGEPFVGAAGRLLDNMLRAVGLGRGATDYGSGSAQNDSEDAAENFAARSGIEPALEADPRRQVYIANTLKCRPPGNRNPQPAELQKCEPFLVRQIELVQPRVILAMGRFAVQALLRTDEAIGRLRGRVHHYQGVPLIVTYHPAYLLRNLPDKARAWEDLCLAMQTVRAAEPALTTMSVQT